MKTIRTMVRDLSKELRLVKIAYRFFRENKPLVDDFRESPYGFKLVGNDLMARGLFEPDETQLAIQMLEQADVLVNVGANIGYYCCHALQMKKQVIAFEPMDSNLRLLYKNINANQWDRNIEIFPLALSDHAGLLDIYGKGTGASLVKGWANTPEDRVRTIPSSTMDVVLANRLHGCSCLVIVDIEGAEKRMLDGAELLLSNSPKPMWMVEISTSHHQPNGVEMNPDLLATFEIFWNHGYEAWTATQTPRLVERSEVTKTSEGGEDTLLTHNFLFVEEGRRDLVPSVR